jgi:Uma2 family endonuclease
MARQNPVWQASFAEYLELEAHSQQRHEFVDGYIFAMAGGADYHNHINSRLDRLVFDAAEAAGCELFIADMILKPPSGRGHYPDLPGSFRRLAFQTVPLLDCGSAISH